MVPIQEPSRPDPVHLLLVAMSDRAFVAAPKWKSQQLRANREGAHPRILEFEKALVKKMASLGVPMFAHEFVRDEARQTELFIRGHSKAKAGQSPHQFGLAVDIIHSVKAWNLTRAQWDLIGRFGKELATQRGLHVKWGGDFETIWDPAHWELRDWKNHKDATTWPPPKN